MPASPSAAGSGSLSGFEAEDRAASAYRRLGYVVRQRVMVGGLEIDLIIERDGERTPVEVTTLPRGRQLDKLRQMTHRLSSLAETKGYLGKPIIVIAGSTDPAIFHWARFQTGVMVMTLEALEAEAGPAPAPAPPEDVAREHEAIEARHGAEREAARAKLIEQLRQHDAGQLKLTPKDYEHLCMATFIFVFDPVLFGFKSQSATSDGANRYDFICRIGHGNAFWEGIRRDFKTRAILFECKNYAEPITADQIYSTERYLFAGALRTVCFLLARKGATDGGHRAAQGAMRESGKLILVLSNQDLVQLLEIGITQEAAENLLDEKIWDFIISLPR